MQLVKSNNIIPQVSYLYFQTVTVNIAYIICKYAISDHQVSNRLWHFADPLTTHFNRETKVIFYPPQTT